MASQASGANAVATCMSSPDLLSLEQLDFGAVWLQTDAGVQFLSHVCSMSSLQRPELGADSCVRNGIIDSYSSCCSLSALTYLGLRSCDFRDEGVVHLAPAIEIMGALRELQIH